MSNSNNSVGCGCFSTVLGILTLWAWLFGLPTPWGLLDIDLLPPAIRLERGKVHYELTPSSVLSGREW